MNQPRSVARGGLVLLAALFAVASSNACTKKASPKQCEEMLDRFIELSAKEQMPDASAERKAQVRGEARADEAFKNCTSTVQPSEFECAMRAQTSETMMKCLE
jgi:hypothetical protein